MNNSHLDLSIIIPTVNASDELDLTLTSLEKNSDLSLEIVVVVDPDLNTGKINKPIIQVCKKHGVEPHPNLHNLGPYGNWNKGATLATADYLVFATDDQYFAPHWDTNLLKSWRPKRLVAGRLVEPGVIPVYKTNLEQDFGTIPSEFKEAEFNKWCQDRPSAGFVKDGFFIPLLQSRKDFEALGRYTNSHDFGTSSAKSNDYDYINRALAKGYQFGTADNSYSYHFQASSWKKKTLKPTIAAVVLTRNEERDLGACLRSLSWVNHILVLDAGSTDQTIQVAKKAGATVLTRQFDNYSAQRNFALKQVVKYDWVFMLDADETCDDELSYELQSFAKDIYLDGVEVPRKNYLFGKWIEHTDWYPDYRPVFFRPKLGKYVGEVHEALSFSKDAKLAKATGHILHHNYDRLSEFVTKNLVDYPLNYAKILDREGVKFNPIDLIGKSIGEFMRRYFLTEGYRDGLYGLILSLLMGVQTLVAYAYLWEIQGKREELTSSESKMLFAQLKGKGSELSYWLTTMAIDTTRGATKLLHKVQRKALKLIKGL